MGNLARTETVKLSKLKPNPDNPRFIKDDKFKKLVKSLQEFPEMLSVRPLIVNKNYMILGGNMRYRAMKEAGWEECEVTVVDWPEDKQREFIIKDNVAGGEWDWDKLANEWDMQELEAWGLETVDWDIDESESQGDKDTQFIIELKTPHQEDAEAALEEMGEIIKKYSLLANIKEE